MIIGWAPEETLSGELELHFNFSVPLLATSRWPKSLRAPSTKLRSDCAFFFLHLPNQYNKFKPNQISVGLKPISWLSMDASSLEKTKKQKKIYAECMLKYLHASQNVLQLDLSWRKVQQVNPGLQDGHFYSSFTARCFHFLNKIE